MKTILPPASLAETLSVSYVRALLNGEAQTHLGALQNACLANTIRHSGRLIVSLDGNAYDVTPSRDNPVHVRLAPLTATANGKTVLVSWVNSVGLSWGIAAFQTAILRGEIRLDRTFREGCFLLA